MKYVKKDELIKYLDERQMNVAKLYDSQEIRIRIQEINAIRIAVMQMATDEVIPVTISEFPLDWLKQHQKMIEKRINALEMERRNAK